MTTLKSFTSLKQSRKLAEILPLESADMCYIQDLLAGGKYGEYRPYIGNIIPAYGQDKIKCWSLAALLGVLPVMIDYKGSLIRLRIDKGHVGQDEYAIWYDDLDNGLSTNIASESKNLVDACYEMIIKLHELKML